MHKLELLNREVVKAVEEDWAVAPGAGVTTKRVGCRARQIVGIASAQLAQPIAVAGINRANRGQIRVASVAGVCGDRRWVQARSPKLVYQDRDCRREAPASRRPAQGPKIRARN